MGSHGTTALVHPRPRAPLGLLRAAALGLTMSGALLACGRGDAEVDALAAHVRAVVERIEAHPGDPNAALRAISAYERDHAAALDSLRVASKKLRRDLGTQAKRSLHERWTRETRALRARTAALRRPER